MSPSLPSRCPKNGQCNLEQGVIEERVASKPFCFVAIPSDEMYRDTGSAIRKVVEGGEVLGERYEPKYLHGRSLNAVFAIHERFIGQGTCKICQLCWFADFGIAELGTLNANVMIEIGLLLGFGKRVIYTMDKYNTSPEELPFDLGNPMLALYKVGNVRVMADRLEDKINFLIRTMPSTEGEAQSE